MVSDVWRRSSQTGRAVGFLKVFYPVLSTGGINPRHFCQLQWRNAIKGERERNVERVKEREKRDRESQRWRLGCDRRLAAVPLSVQQGQ